jgi:rod shape-determining protein MreD
MQPTVLQRVDQTARKLVPFGLTLLLLLFAMTPTYIPGLSHITPLYAFMSVFFWSIYRADLLGFGTVFAIGMLDDLLGGTPLGSGALILLLCQRIVLEQQKFFHTRPFTLTWAAFALLTLGASLIRWICVGLAGGSGFTPISSTIASCFMTIALYPIVAWVLAKAQMKLLVQP